MTEQQILADIRQLLKEDEYQDSTTKAQAIAIYCLVKHLLKEETNV